MITALRTIFNDLNDFIKDKKIQRQIILKRDGFYISPVSAFFFCGKIE